MQRVIRNPRSDDLPFVQGWYKQNASAGTARYPVLGVLGDEG